MKYCDIEKFKYWNIEISKYRKLKYCASVHLCICPSIHLSIYPSVHLSFCPSVPLSICPVRLSTCPSVCLSIFPSVCPSIFPSLTPLWLRLLVRLHTCAQKNSIHIIDLSQITQDYLFLLIGHFIHSKVGPGVKIYIQVVKFHKIATLYLCVPHCIKRQLLSLQIMDNLLHLNGLKFHLTKLVLFHMF